MFDTNVLIAGVIFGAFGMGYFAYGKSTSNYIALISGLILMVYPYFISNIYALWGIGVVCIILPFFIKG